MYNIHDSEITSYQVDLENHKIIMNIKHRDKKHIKIKKIIFKDVFSHLFQHELIYSTIFDIEQYDINKFIEDNNGLLKKEKNYVWPTQYDTIEELTEKLFKKRYIYYVISSSYGLNGWVLAKNMEINEQTK